MTKATTKTAARRASADTVSAEDVKPADGSQVDDKGNVPASAEASTDLQAPIQSEPDGKGVPRGDTTRDVLTVGEAAKNKATTLSTVVVLIQRDPMQKIPKRVFEHEIELLNALHGEDSVEVQEGTERDQVVRITADDEYARLQTVYGKRGAEALRLVYGGQPGALARASGLPGGNTMKNRATRKMGGSAQRGAGA